MAHRAERGHEKINFLRAPTRLRNTEERNQQNRRADIKDEIAPTVQDPKIAFGKNRRDRRDGLRTRKCGDVLHGRRGLYFPQIGGKINPGLIRFHRKIDIFLHAP